MIPRSLEATITEVGIPRESGDDPAGVITAHPADMYSPRERG